MRDSAEIAAILAFCFVLAIMTYAAWRVWHRMPFWPTVQMLWAVGLLCVWLPAELLGKSLFGLELGVFGLGITGTTVCWLTLIVRDALTRDDRPSKPPAQGASTVTENDES